jgi:large subunit GTPase 1
LALERVAGKKKAPATRVGKDSITFIPMSVNEIDKLQVQGVGRKSNAIDQGFFEDEVPLAARPFIQGGSRDGASISRVRIYPHQNLVADDGTPLAQNEVVMVAGQRIGKKSHKKPKRVKQRSGKGYE